MAFRAIIDEFRDFGKIIRSSPSLLEEKQPLRLRQRIAERLEARKPLFSGERVRPLRRGFVKPEYEAEQPTSSQPSKVHRGQETVTPRQFLEEKLPMLGIIRQKIEKGELMPIRRAIAKRIENSSLKVETKQVHPPTQQLGEREVSRDQAGHEAYAYRGLKAATSQRCV